MRIGIGRVSRVAAALGVAGLLALPAAGIAHAATPAAAPSPAARAVALASPPRRTDNVTNAVYFVHGYKGKDEAGCKKTWSKAIAAYKKWGWRGSLITYGYYKGDNKDCSVKYDGNTNTSIAKVAQVLAWDIYYHHSRYNRSVDIVAHSMGGLVVRSALASVHAHLSGFPPYLYVEDVVTLGTPHGGTWVAKFCRTGTQCKQMRPGSTFLKHLAQNPQSAQGTDWTLVGSTSDKTVSSSKATAMRAGHTVIFKGKVSHSSIRQTTSGTFKMTYRNYWDHSKPHNIKGAPPIRVAFNACYWWWKW